MITEATTRETLFEEHFHLVKRHARRIGSRMPNAVDLNDLIQAGSIGLLDAIKSWNPEKTKLATYAVFRIRGAMMDWLREIDPIPRLTRKRVKKFLKTEDDLARESGTKPTAEMVFDFSDIGGNPRETLRAVVDCEGIHHNCLDRDNRGHKEFSYDELTSRRRSLRELVDPEFRRIELRDYIHRRIARGFSKTERCIIWFYYSEELTMKQIGTCLNLSESRVSQIHSNVLRRLREMAEAGLIENPL